MSGAHEAVSGARNHPPPPRAARRARWIMATLLLAALAGCAADSTGDGPRQTLTVFAASSLKAPFEEARRPL